jgi:hypothetical protein
MKTQDKIKAEKLDGKCVVQYIDDISDLDSWIQLEDHYFIAGLSTLPTDDHNLLHKLCNIDSNQSLGHCPHCLEYQDNFHRLYSQLRKAPLQALDLFSGLCCCFHKYKYFTEMKQEQVVCLLVCLHLGQLKANGQWSFHLVLPKPFSEQSLNDKH